MRIICIDTETAGFAPPSKGSGICDIAIANIDEDFGIYWKIESLIDPECSISPGAMGVHHITDEMVADQPTLSEFMEQYKYPLNEVNVVMGHNVQFDIRFVRPFLP